jgi:aspartate/methionine/tyrosine aminotransferase
MLKLAPRMEQVKYEIRDIVVRAKQVEKKGKKMHWLNIGDPNQFDFLPPEHVRKAAAEAAASGKYSAYCPSQGDEELRVAVGKIEGVPAEHTFITSGLSEGIDFLFTALIGIGEEALLPNPTYPLYVSKARVHGASDAYYPSDSDFIPVAEELRKSVTGKTRSIVVINPNNPTGATYPRKVLQEIADVAAEFKLPLIADEIYDQLTLDEDHSINMRDVAGDDVLLITGNGISKNYLYPGARVGYLAVRGPGAEELSSALLKLCNARLSVNWEMQRAALAAFTGPKTHLAETKRKLRERRDVMMKRFSEMGGVHCARPTAAFYALPKFEGLKFKDDKEFVYSMIEETGIVMVPGSAFSPHLDGIYARLVFLPKPDELNEAMDKLGDFLKKSRK